MKTWLLLLGCLLALTSQAQTRREVYAWKDAQGVTHYSDYPQPGARKILLNGAPSTTKATPPATTPAGATPAAAKPAAKPGATEVVYDRLEIWSPENGANFFVVEKFARVAKMSNMEVYAIMRGESFEDFLKTRLVPAAR